MKKVFFMALMVLFTIKAIAADELTQVTVTPDPSVEQTSLSKITVQFTQTQSGISTVDVSGITLTCQTESESTVYYALSSYTIDYAKLSLEFGAQGATEAVEFKENGKYILHIPAGAVTAHNDEGSNAELDITFTVSASVQTVLSRYELSPAAGVVEEISVIAISFPDSKNGLDWFYKSLYGGDEMGDITLTAIANNDVYTATKKNFNSNNKVELAFVKQGAEEQATLSEEGTYRLHIPAKMFKEDFAEVYNEEITVDYVISGTEPEQPEEPEDFKDMVAIPADGAVVGSLSSLTLAFPNLTEGLDYPIENIGRITILTPDNETFYAFNARVGNYGDIRYAQLSVDFGAENESNVDHAKLFTAAGTYRVTVPENVLKAYHKDVTNPEIVLSFTIDPKLNFTYGVSPEPGTVHDGFEDIVFTAGSSISTLTLAANNANKATISLGEEESYDLTPTQVDERTVALRAPENARAVAGDWRIKIPAGYFSGKNSEDVLLSNREIELTYTVKEPETFDYVLTPAEGATVEFFKNVMVAFGGENLKTVEIDPAAGTPVITRVEGGQSHNLVGRVNIKMVIFDLPGGVSLESGEYSVTVPAGYIKTVDKDNLKAKVEAINTTLVIDKKSAGDYTDGILFLNEGWFGVDYGSLNFYGNDQQWVYDAFLRNNPDHHLGITSQYGHCFGNKIYVTSKQEKALTVMDAATLKFVGEIAALPDEESTPYAFCAWDEHKGYLSASNKIYVVDLDNFEIKSVVPETDVLTTVDASGEMIRYGDYVYAIRQFSGVAVIDPTDDAPKETIAAELAVAFALTPDGSLYVATQNESNEFIKIPTDGQGKMEKFDIAEDYAKITSDWDTWRKAPLATDMTANAVYYVTTKAASESAAGARTVAKYDFDKREFTEKFIELPGVADGEAADWVLYGEGVSVDPGTGLILLTAVEAGYGEHYRKNRVFMADPATGKILDHKTLRLEDAYWFPAMTLYPDFEAPVIDTAGLDLGAQEAAYTLDLAGRTTLKAGNRHLIRYAVTASDKNCTVTQTGPGVFDIAVGEAAGDYTLTLRADYQGKITTVKWSSSNSEIPDDPVNPVADTVATPTFSVAAGEVEAGTEVTIACATENARIYYTADGSEPTAESTAYTEAVVIDKTMTLKAIAFVGENKSKVATAAYKVKATANEDLFLAGVSVYPNPSDGLFTLDLPVAAKVEVFGLTGVVMQRIEAGAGLMTLNIGRSGIYFIRITASGRTAVKRVVVR